MRSRLPRKEPVARHQLASIGQPIGEMDMMIAAHALSLGAVLVTNNMRHFGRIAAPLALVNWNEGSPGTD